MHLLLKHGIELHSIHKKKYKKQKQTVPVLVLTDFKSISVPVMQIKL